MNNEPSLQQPQIEFVKHFMQLGQIQRMLIYFSKQKPTDPKAQYGFTDIIVRLINDPLCIVFGQHGLYLFSSYLLVYPYNELDTEQVSYVTKFLSMHINNNTSSNLILQDQDHAYLAPSMQIDARVTKQMGGGYTVRPVQLTNIRLDTFDILTALVRGVMYGSQKHNVSYRKHALNLQLQRILTRIVVSRAQLQAINVEIESCVETKEQHTTTENGDSEQNVECV
jgi:hypothetical protein